MRIFLLAFVLFLTLNVSAEAQAKTPDAVAREFYRWYLTELNADRYPIVSDKPGMLTFISTRLSRRVYSPDYSEYGADYFIDAQDWDRTWVDGISTTRPVIKGNSATLQINLRSAKDVFSGFGRRTLPIKLVKEHGSWKIDIVNNRKFVK